MAHGQWTEIEARGVLEAWKKSSQTLDGYARSRGLVPAQLAMLLDGIDLNARRLARWDPGRDRGIDTDRRL